MRSISVVLLVLSLVTYFGSFIGIIIGESGGSVEVSIVVFGDKNGAPLGIYVD